MLTEVVVFLFLCYLALHLFRQLKEYVRFRTLASELPTLSDKNPIIGHLRKTLNPKTSVQFFSELRQWNQDHFPIFTIYNIQAIDVVISGPEEIEKVISTMKNTKKNVVYSFLHGWLGQGLLTSEGQKWQTRRKILTPAFHFNILQQFISIFNDETNVLIDNLNKKVCENPVIDVLPLISDMTLRTINETSMGVKLNFNTKEGHQYRQDIYQIGEAVYYRFLRPWLWLDFFYYNLFESGRHYKKLTSSLHRFTEKIIKERETGFIRFDASSDKSLEDSFSKRMKMAFLDLLINEKLRNEKNVDEKGIRDEVNTFMFEGHDTTAMNISYTLMLLANNPNEQEKVYEELIQALGTEEYPTHNQLQELQYMERCIKESLRLYPSVPFIGRTAEEEIVTKYGTIPKGMPVYLMIYDMHRHPKLWPDPEKFDPDRFTVENSIGRHPYSYIPFSAGPRNCIGESELNESTLVASSSCIFRFPGQRFAILEAKAVLCGVLRKYRLEAVDTPESLVLIQDLILRPKNGVRVKFVPRD